MAGELQIPPPGAPPGSLHVRQRSAPVAASKAMTSPGIFGRSLNVEAAPTMASPLTTTGDDQIFAPGSSTELRQRNWPDATSTAETEPSSAPTNSVPFCTAGVL